MAQYHIYTIINLGGSSLIRDIGSRGEQPGPESFRSLVLGLDASILFSISTVALTPGFCTCVEAKFIRQSLGTWQFFKVAFNQLLV